MNDSTHEELSNSFCFYVDLADVIIEQYGVNKVIKIERTITTELE